MTIRLDRTALARQMTDFVGRSEAMRSMEAAMLALYPSQRAPSTRRLAELVLYSIVRGHQAHTRKVLDRINVALARLLDDLDALRSGRSLEGRTDGARAEDLTKIAQAHEDLRKLEDHVNFLLQTDESGSWASQLRIELETALGGGRGGHQASRAAATPIEGLRSALHVAAPDPQAIIHGRSLPPAVGDAAHALVVAAGGDVGTAVRRLLRESGPDTDSLVVAVLWREGRIRPGTPLGTSEHAEHQRVVTGLDYEWTGQLAPGSLGREVGLDGVAGGFVVDAKHSSVPVEESPHLLGGAAKRPRHEGEHEPDVAAQVARATAPPPDPSRVERAIIEKRHEVLEQMRRQLDFARHNGLRGIRWVCNDEALSEAFRLLTMELPSHYDDLQKNFVVGGLR